MKLILTQESLKIVKEYFYFIGKHSKKLIYLYFRNFLTSCHINFTQSFIINIYLILKFQINKKHLLEIHKITSAYT
jgi:hypothetical protein